MIITLASSDKLTLAMFSDFYRSIYASNALISDLSYLYSPDILSSFIDKIIEKSNRGAIVLIRYSIKTQTKELNPIILEKSDVLIKFDIFSTEPEVIKSLPDTEAMVIRWKDNIAKRNKQVL